jgi:hypothetical protein
MTKVLIDEGLAPTGYAVGIEYYVPTETQRDNRLEFSDDEIDATGMPRITVHFTYTEKDVAHLDRARVVVRDGTDESGVENAPVDGVRGDKVLPHPATKTHTATVAPGWLRERPAGPRRTDAIPTSSRMAAAGRDGHPRPTRPGPETTFRAGAPAPA